MATLTLTGSFSTVRGALQKIAEIGRDPQPVLAAAALALEDSTRRRFDEGVDPTGRRWADYAPLNPLYAMGKKDPTAILRESGKLRDTIISKAVGRTFTIGSPLPYAAVHQFGAIIQPKNGNHLSFMMAGRLWHVDSVDIPERPYLGFSEEDSEILVLNLGNFLNRAMRG